MQDKSNLAKNFEALTVAFATGGVCVVECRRRSNDEPVALICAIIPNKEGVEIRPFAELIDGNPYAVYAPPADYTVVDNNTNPDLN